ncbi:MAG: trehalose-phosphatase [Acidimicrobiales bacterium]
MAVVSADEVVSRLATRPASTGIFTDFDGTLSATVPDPESARPVVGAVEALRALARVIAEVAVISGRPAAWLAQRLGPAPVHGLELFGLHGLERWNGTAAEPVDAARPFVEVVARARDRAVAAGIDGLFVEDKILGLTLHWRRADDPVTTGVKVMELAGELARSTGLVLRPGKASAELVLPIGVDKGTVVSGRAVGLAVVAFLGDDLSDILAFDALDALAAAGVEVARIAVAGSEAPAELIERADLVLANPAESVHFLRALAEAAEAAAANESGAWPDQAPP